MDMIPIPEFSTMQIARRAVEIARIIGPRKTGKGLTLIMPYWEEGIVGIEVPDNAKYLLDIDEGIKEHPMTGLAGRNIPVRSPGGTLYIRKATEKTIGQTPIINRSSVTGGITDNKPEWMYPGKEGTNFMERSLMMSINEWASTLKSTNIVSMLLQSKVKDSVSMVIYGREMA
jgi:hypothetical protein